MQSVEVADEVDFKALAQQTDGYSGDDITGVCRDAAMNSMRRQIKGLSHDQLVAMKDRVVHQPVNMEDFLQAYLPPSLYPRTLLSSQLDNPEEYPRPHKRQMVVLSGCLAKLPVNLGNLKVHDSRLD